MSREQSSRGMDRRQFFRVVATTTATAAAAGCGPSTERLLPYVVPPENLVPGVASWFATVCRECPAGCGAIARNREGRVVKLDGNPDHPINAGTLCIRGQAALQGLYNPDRIRGPLLRDSSGTLKPIKWEEVEQLLTEKLAALVKAKQGGRIALVSQLEAGSLGRLMDEWTKALGVRPRIAYEPFAHESLRAASRIAFGREAIPQYAIEEATVLLSFGADFLETWLSPVGYARGYARMHAFKHGRAGTFVHIEPRLSLTASSADEWVRNAPGTEALLALALLRVIVDEGLQAPGVDVATLKAAVREVDVAAAAGQSGVPVETVTRLARDFARGKPSVAIGGGVAVSGENATELQLVLHLLNYAVGNIGRAVRFGPDSVFGRASAYREVLSLTQVMEKGEVGVLLLYRVNPLFTLPARAGFAAALKKVPFVVSFSDVLDETTTQAHLVLPDLHPLESWGDFSPQDGVYGLMQPTMGVVPGYEARAVGDVLLAVGRAVLGSPEGKGPFRWESFESYLKDRWRGLAKELAPRTPFDAFWEESLRRGGAWKSVAPVGVRLRTEAAKVAGAIPKLKGDGQGFVLLAYPSVRFYDGRGANKPWLQEAPDTMTQVSWDSWVEVPAQTAGALGIRQGDVVTLTSPHGSIELPAYVSESLHPGTVAVPIGQGHTAYGRYATDGIQFPSANPVAVFAGGGSETEAARPRGANPIVLLGAEPEAASGGLPWLSVRVTLAKTGRRRPLAVVQATANQDDRGVAQHVSLAAARELELRGAVPEKASLPSMYPDLKYPEHRWGMAVDVDACIGCQACVVACQAENNVAVVGKEQLAYGRGMHWLRVERWQEGKPSHPETLFLPMFCQHCEIAPCEPVCPVFAAYHTNEGLNAQIYNRCVGTRYCGNNCPYHVRRFNWFYNQFPEPLHLQLNPDVTVRQLGIMEKCTMCIQRIIAGKDAAKDAGRKVRDGDIVTACQQTCPTQAIVFGDLKEPQSRVAKLARSPRGYHVLEELGTRPAVTYLKKVTREPGKGRAPKTH
ncbi:MAG: molybdopterin-dependent oxidoreductase [Candidatus Rokubacteria bacterium]|nr:molybdopterin-dependent oxidoreductase [Candidatus Rokubacteria bacterium]